MTQHKDLKRRVRARMRKTGEAYTTARAQIMKKPKPRVDTRASASPPITAPVSDPSTRSQPSPAEYAAIAGISDEKVKQSTGCTWERWVHALDHYHADEMSHTEIATLIRTKYKKTPRWWTQMVAVGYERIRGLRARGQRRTGSRTSGRRVATGSSEA